MKRGKGKSEEYQFEIFKMMSDNWERIESGEVELLAEDIATRFDITVDRARTRITHYFYNRMMDRPIRGFEQDGKIVLTYPSRV